MIILSVKSMNKMSLFQYKKIKCKLILYKTISFRYQKIMSLIITKPKPQSDNCMRRGAQMRPRLKKQLIFLTISKL